MKWKVEWHDGFTERLLGFTIEVDGKTALLEASWFGLKPANRKFVTMFEIDDSRIQRLFPHMATIGESYDCGWDDVSIWLLSIEADKQVTCKLRGARLLVEMHPELIPIVEFFRWVEKQVILQLPWGKPA